MDEMARADLHVLKHQHGLALPWTCAIELYNTPIKTQRFQNLNLLQTQLTVAAEACFVVRKHEDSKVYKQAV